MIDKNYIEQLIGEVNHRFEVNLSHQEIYKLFNNFNYITENDFLFAIEEVMTWHYPPSLRDIKMLAYFHHLNASTESMYET